MEFPDIGQHCFEPTCKQLDFLPMKCDGCSNVFCLEHMSYNNHACPGAYKKDVQVPVCPLCNTPIPIKRGDPPDILVGRHIDNNCESDTAKNHRKVFANRCSSKGCKVRELMPIKCSDCQRNFCLRHRHPTDHNCTTAPASSKAANAALARQQKSEGIKGWFKSTPAVLTQAKEPHKSEQRVGSNKFASVQGNLDEDEALARALSASLQGSQPTSSSTQAKSATEKAQEDEDYNLAKAIQESEKEMYPNTRSNASNSGGKCEVS